MKGVETSMARGIKANARFYVILGLVIAIIIIWRGFRPKGRDFRLVAKEKVQLASGLVSDSCAQAYADVALPDIRLSIVVSTQATEEAVITQTINSILAHTDPAVLEEIIIATGKDITEEKKQLLVKEFSIYHPIVKVANANANKRIRNKLVIGHSATGDIVLFIDDTIVVTENYLLPLLTVLEAHPERIAVPTFDYLTDMTASAETSWTQRKWLFDWFLNIHSYELSFQELASKPENQESSVMVFDSSAFALHRSYLSKLGSLKNDMAYSSSIDLSLATWLCGDGAYVVPCSRVAKINAHLTIPMDNEKVRYNIAHRYFIEGFLAVFNRVNKKEIELNEEDKKHMRVEASLQKRCPKKFDWYMKNIVKEEVFVPSANAVAYGYFNSNSGTVCFRQTPAMIFLGFIGCKMHKRDTMIEYLKSGQLRMGTECLTASVKGYVVTDPCDYEKDAYKWTLTEHKQFKEVSSNRCISHSTDPYKEEMGRQVLMFTECTDETNPSSFQWQKWNSFIYLE